MIEINDTLQITKAQGFPAELDFATHQNTPYSAADFDGKIFEFHDKPKIRAYHQPPVRNFLVENIDGKWLYWGLIHVLGTHHDYAKNTTSGKYKIIHIYSPEEMKQAHAIVDRNPETNYFIGE
ncbi:MAG: hypothetical protein ACK5MU_03315 [Candidatus Saccharimonadales bacterium]